MDEARSHRHIHSSCAANRRHAQGVALDDDGGRQTREEHRALGPGQARAGRVPDGEECEAGADEHEKPHSRGDAAQELPAMPGRWRGHTGLGEWPS